MGSVFSKNNDENCYINQIKNINEDDLDLSNIDKLQIKVLKELIKDAEEIKERKSDKVYYRLPAINLCSNSLF